MTSKQWVLTFIGMIAIIPLAQFAERTMGEAASSSDIAKSVTQPNLSQVEAMVSRQSADGATEGDFDQAFLKNLEDWTLQRISANAKKHWDAAAVPTEDRVLKGESLFVERYGHKLAVVRVRSGETTPTASIVGIEGSELIRVMCLDRNGGDVPIASGPCDAKIRENFSVNAVA